MTVPANLPFDDDQVSLPDLEDEPESRPGGLPLYAWVILAVVVAIPVGILWGEGATSLEIVPKLILRALTALAAPLVVLAILSAIVTNEVKGRLIDGNPNELPPAVALSLSHSSNVTFSYREELTHDDYHIPLWFSALDPVTYAGASLGDYGVTALASLSTIDGDRISGDYTAKAYVTKSYSLYSEPTHLELERAARTEVREKIDQKLYADAAKLADAVGAGTPPSGGSIAK